MFYVASIVFLHILLFPS